MNELLAALHGKVSACDSLNRKPLANPGGVDLDARRELAKLVESGFAPGPAERHAVIGVPRQHVQMKMRHGLPTRRPIGLQDRKALRREGALDRGGDLPRHRK